jgi:hypothetical protein
MISYDFDFYDLVQELNFFNHVYCVFVDNNKLKIQIIIMKYLCNTKYKYAEIYKFRGGTFFNGYRTKELSFYGYWEFYTLGKVWRKIIYL